MAPLFDALDFIKFQALLVQIYIYTLFLNPLSQTPRQCKSNVTVYALNPIPIMSMKYHNHLQNQFWLPKVTPN